MEKRKDNRGGHPNCGRKPINYPQKKIQKYVHADIFDECMAMLNQLNKKKINETR